MNIAAMMEREPFYEILCQTMILYYKEVEKKEIVFCDKKGKDTDELFLYYTQSFLSGRFPTKSMRDFLYSEYNIRGSLIKYIAGKAGVFLITHSMGLIAKKRFFVRGISEADTFITPCNRSVRFYHFREGYVDCIVKDGYPETYMQNQLRFRLSHNYSFVPKIITYGERWYREKIMYGNALIRVRDKATYLYGQKITLKYLGEIVKNTLVQIEAGEYIETLKKEVKELLEHFSVGNASASDKVFGDLFCFIKGILPAEPLQIPTAVTHGDLQGGNIWVTKDREIIIYDWETNKRRTVWFDPATLLWKMHADPFSLDLESLVSEDEQFLVNDRKKDYTAEEKRVIAWILFAENTIFYLEDLAQLPVEYARIQFNTFCEEIVRYIGAKEIHGKG